MAIIRNTASGLRKGRVGNTTYYVSLSRQIARVSQNSSNYGDSASRTLAQQVRRVRWANLVNFYRLNKEWLLKAYQSKEVKQSDYNRFMQINLTADGPILTKNQAAQGMVVLQPYVMSQGSIQSLAADGQAANLVTRLSVGSVEDLSALTVGQFSDALVTNNIGVVEYMQLSLIVYTVDESYADGYAFATPRAYEVTLDRSSLEPLSSYLPVASLALDSGRVAFAWGAFQAGYWVLSLTTSSGLEVSSEVLQFAPNYTPNEGWISDNQLQAAIASYGIDSDVFLDSGSETITGEGGSGGGGGSSSPNPAIARVQLYGGGPIVSPGEYLGTWDGDSAGSGAISFSSTPEAEAVSIAFNGGSAASLSALSLSGRSLSFSYTGAPSNPSNAVTDITVTWSNGLTSSASFLDDVEG